MTASQIWPTWAPASDSPMMQPSLRMSSVTPSSSSLANVTLNRLIELVGDGDVGDDVERGGPPLAREVGNRPADELGMGVRLGDEERLPARVDPLAALELVRHLRAPRRIRHDVEALLVRRRRRTARTTGSW